MQGTMKMRATTTPSRDTREQAARVAMQEERARDAARATLEYEAEKLAVEAKTKNLKALRLAREAATLAKEVAAKVPRKTKAKVASKS